MILLKLAVVVGRNSDVNCVPYIISKVTVEEMESLKEIESKPTPNGLGCTYDR